MDTMIKPRTRANKPNPLAAARQAIAAEDYERAIALLEGTVDAPKTSAEALTMLGVVAVRLGNLAFAVQLFERAEKLPEASTDVPEVLAVLYAMVGNLKEALFYGKLATAKPLDRRVLDVLGPSFPGFAQAFTRIRENPLVELGHRLLNAGHAAEAVDRFQQHVTLNPMDEEGLDGLTRALLAQGQARSAVHYLRSLRALAPAKAVYASRLGEALGAVGEFAAATACHREAQALDGKDVTVPAAFLRHLAYAPEASADARRDARRRLIDAAGPVERPRPWYFPASTPSPLRVGYLVAATPSEDDTRMLAELLRCHDKQRVAPVGIGLEDLSAQRNAPYRMRFARWLDVRGVDKHTLASMVRTEGIDVLVDLGGIFAPHQAAVCSLRAAPVQVAWFGGALGSAAGGIDYRLSDAYASAGADAGPGASPWPLANGLYGFPWPLDPVAPEGPAAANGYVSFGADVSLAEMNADVAMVWSRVLHAVPEARLVLRDRDHRHPDNADRLVDLFGNFGIAHRIEVVSAESRADFLNTVDIALTPFPFARPYPAVEALCQGVPVVALAQAGQVCEDVGFLLKRLGLGETMVASSEDDYVERAAWWAADAKARSAFRAEERLRLASSPVFDPAARAAEIEDAFFAMWRKAAGR